jgi:hypothetical protein
LPRTKGQKDKRTKGQKDKRTKGQKDKRTKGQKDKRTKGHSYITGVKSSITLGPGHQCYKSFYTLNLQMFVIS